MPLRTLIQSLVRRRSTLWVDGRPRTLALRTDIPAFWSTENPIICAGGGNAIGIEQCVTSRCELLACKMENEPCTKLVLREQLRESLLRLHGPLLGGESLALALGHRTAASLRQARRRGQVTVPLFTLANRRGWFALTHDVADWLAERRASPNLAVGGAEQP